MLPMERERAVQKSVCQMVCLIVAQFVFLMGGSGIFMTLERNNAQKGYIDAFAKLKEVQKTLNLNLSQENVLKYAMCDKGLSIEDIESEELPEVARHAWDFISTLYFSITSTTTIGYGHHSPQTGAGQLFCILFSLIGIPLHMVTLGTVGKHLSNVISRFLNWSVGGYINKGKLKKDIGTFLATCTLLILFVIFSAGSVRLSVSDMSYIESFYFIYVTISTIGFGDFVIRFEQETDFNRVMILALWALSLYVGMAILSATIMSISSRAKLFYRKVFNLWNLHVGGKEFKKPKNRRRRDEEDNLIMVDLKFLVAQLDLQTDPVKRTEIQKWIDNYIEEDESDNDYDNDSDYSSVEDGSYDYNPAQENQTTDC